MSEVIEIDSFYTLSEEIKEFVAKFNELRTRIGLRLRENTEWDSTYQISLIQESLNIRRTVKLLCDDLLNNQLSDPSLVSNL
jgi:flagellar capping protein FliD